MARPIRQLAGVLILAVAGLAGCEGGGPSLAGPLVGDNDGGSAKVRSEVGLVPRARPPIPDLPVPVGFKLVESVSRDYESDNLRFVDHTYRGDAALVQVKRFVNEQMPRKGWTLETSQFVRGVHTLRFRKGEELAVAEIAMDQNLFGQTTARLIYGVQTVESE